MNIKIDDIAGFLKEISGIVSSLLIIIGFLVAAVKPVRVKFAEWITKQARTPQLIERLEAIDDNIKSLNGEVITINNKLTEHAKENSVDIKNANTAQMMSLRCQIREIYTYNYQNKNLTVREKRDIFDLYDAYVALGGNGYIESMLEEMKDWTIHTGI